MRKYWSLIEHIVKQPDMRVVVEDPAFVPASFKTEFFRYKKTEAGSLLLEGLTPIITPRGIEVEIKLVEPVAVSSPSTLPFKLKDL